MIEENKAEKVITPAYAWSEDGDEWEAAFVSEEAAIQNSFAILGPLKSVWIGEVEWIENSVVTDVVDDFTASQFLESVFDRAELPFEANGEQFSQSPEQLKSLAILLRRALEEWIKAHGLGVPVFKVLNAREVLL